MKMIYTRWISLVVILIVFVQCMSFAASAENAAPETVWNGAGHSVEVKAGANGYTFMSIYRKPGNAYEMSNHMVSVNEGVNNDIPQTLVLLDATKDYVWTPDGKYVHGESNYEVLYCCDAATGYEDGVYYKRLNLEDSEYYSAEQAEHIRAIVMNSYPYVTLEQMKENLKAEGFEEADELTRADVITAVQAAIWAYANVEAGNYVYSQTFHVPANTQWGTVMHDYTNEMDVWWQTGKRQFTKDEATANRINALIEYLKARESIAAEPEQIIITELEIVKAVSAIDAEDALTTTVRVMLNNSGSGEGDDLKLDLYVDDTLAETREIRYGVSEYEFTLETKLGQTIKVVASGTQVVAEGVYFYEPEGGRDTSQCLVGIASGNTDVWAESSITVPVTTDIKVTKHWIDEENKDDARPEFVTIRLYANGEEVATAQLSASGNQEWTFENLDLYRDGVPIVYTISEDAVEGYETSVNGFEITNMRVFENEENKDPSESPGGDINVPPTGDRLSAMLITVAIAAVGMTLLLRRKRAYHDR